MGWLGEVECFVETIYCDLNKFVDCWLLCCWDKILNPLCHSLSATNIFPLAIRPIQRKEQHRLHFVDAVEICLKQKHYYFHKTFFSLFFNRLLVFQKKRKKILRSMNIVNAKQWRKRGSKTKREKIDKDYVMIFIYLCLQLPLEL